MAKGLEGEFKGAQTGERSTCPYPRSVAQAYSDQKGVGLPSSFSPRRDLGQHFILDNEILGREAKRARIGEEDIVLEIGAGIGNLTRCLAERSRRVLAIECDRRFEPFLRKRTKENPNIEVLWGDALDLRFPTFDKVVSNLPFRIALPLTFKILEHAFQVGVLVYQRTLARRLSARAGHSRYCRVSVQLQRLAEFVIVEDVDRNSFHPAPEVDCAMVKMEPFPARFRIPSKAYFRRTLDYLFFRREVSLRDALLSLRRCNLPENVEAVVEECGDLAGRRVGRLRPEEFGLVALSLHGNGVRVPGVSNSLKRRAQNPWGRGRRRGRSGRSKR